MPGLVGAALRKGGFYSAMRSQISWKADDDAPRQLDGPPDTIRLKLFNTVLRDIGPTLLRHGVLVDRLEAMGAVGAWCSDLNDTTEGEWVSLQVTSR